MRFERGATRIFTSLFSEKNFLTPLVAIERGCELSQAARIKELRLVVATRFETVFQERVAAEVDFFPGLVEVVVIPRVGDFALMVLGEAQEHPDFPLGILAVDAAHVADVLAIHPDEKVVAVVVASVRLSGALGAAVDSVTLEEPSRSGVDGRAEFFRTCRGGRDLKLIRDPRVLDLAFHHKLRHRTATDVAVADK